MTPNSDVTPSPPTQSQDEETVSGTSLEKHRALDEAMDDMNLFCALEVIRGREGSDVREGGEGSDERERMAVNSYNLRLRCKYIGSARMFELQGITGYSFIPNFDR